MNSLLMKNLRFMTRSFNSTPQFFSMQYVYTQRRFMITSQFSRRHFTTQMNENEVIEYVEGKVFEVLKSAAKCNHSKLSRTATFEELGFDSLDGVELVLAMEEHFGFDISN